MHKGFNIVHDTTASSPRIVPIHKALRELGYDIRIHCLFASSEARVDAINYRVKDQGLAMVTPGDARGKVAPVFERLFDFIEYAKELRLYVQPEKFWELPLRADNCFSILEGVYILSADKTHINTLEAQAMDEAAPELQQQVLALLKGNTSLHFVDKEQAKQEAEVLESAPRQHLKLLT